MGQDQGETPRKVKVFGGRTPAGIRGMSLCHLSYPCLTVLRAEWGSWGCCPNVGFTGELLKLGKLGLCLEPTTGEMQLNAITSD